MCSSGALMFKVRDTDAGCFAYARGSRETEVCINGTNYVFGHHQGHLA